jgi:sodium-dependent dicarboxylate transporter 2/3/5
MSEGETPAEEAQDTARPRLWILLLAIAAASAAALVAPRSWPAGSGRLQIEYRGDPALDAEIEFGAEETTNRRAESAGIQIEVEFPEGVPLDAPIRALVSVREKGELQAIALEDLALSLTLPDGRVEAIPSLRFHEETRTLEAQRRPPVQAPVVLALLGTVVVLWVSELVPLYVTSLLIPVVLVFSGVASTGNALKPFFSPIIVLFFAGFLMARAMNRSRLDHLAAVTIVAKTARSPKTLFAAMLAASAFLSMWMSNTAAVAVLIPIAIAVTEPLHHLGYRKAVVLGIAYAGTLGGVGSAIGTPANQLAIELLDTFDMQAISFVHWFAFGVPVVVLLLPIIGVYLWKRIGVSVDTETFQIARAAARKELEETGPPTGNQYLVLLIFAGIVGGWLTQTMHGHHPGMVALAGALVLAALGRILPADLQKISWSSLLTFGGGLTLGLFLVQTGTSDWVATRLGALSALPGSLSILALALVSLALTSVASNTASAAILIPIAIPLASVLGVDPVLLVVVVAIASSLDFALVIGTPPTMIAYSTSLYTTSEIFRLGIVLDLICVLLLGGGVIWLWRLFGLV